MNIAIIGTRGIPANYGGFETFAENLAVRLVKSGHRVTVYCRSNYVDKAMRSYKGVDLVVLPTIRHKYLDTVAHAFLASCHVAFGGAQAVYFCNPVTSFFIPIPRLFGKKTVLNVDGLERKRKKWNRLARIVSRMAEYAATVFPHRIVTDSRAIHDYYLNTYGKESAQISYGADISAPVPPGGVMSSLGLARRSFILYVSRLEPENNAHTLIEAYSGLPGDVPLVILGDAPYNSEYKARLKAAADRRVVFAGSIYGEGYRELLSNAFLYIHGNEVGGTNPALLQAMADGNCVIANGVIYNREVIADAGVCYEPGDARDLASKIKYFLDNPGETDKYRNLAVERIRKFYDWDDVCRKTEDLIGGLVGKK